MATIKLSNFGEFFAGRSHAVEIISQFEPQKDEDTTVDFQGVKSFSQSFASELFFQMKKFGFNLGRTELVNFSEENLKKRAELEKNRIRTLD